MVISKRCKICAVLDTNNVSITGEYFGKNIPEIILKICGVELDPRKASEVLICHPCIIQLVHTDVIIEKLRNAVQRLKRNVRVAKLKTILNKSSENVELQPVKHDANLSKSIKETAAITEKRVSTPKKAVRRKSAYPDEKSDSIEGNYPNGKFLYATPFKKSSAEKRKSISSTTKGVSLVNADIDTCEKRSKTASTCEESPMGLTFEQDGNDTNNETAREEFEEKARNCILCGKIFHSKRTLRNHTETAHMGERLKTCPHCFSEFRSQQKYESHVFGEKCKGSNHVCQFLNCNKRFKTVHKMELHMQQKHSSQNESE